MSGATGSGGGTLPGFFLLASAVLIILMAWFGLRALARGSRVAVSSLGIFIAVYGFVYGSVLAGSLLQQWWHDRRAFVFSDWYFEWRATVIAMAGIVAFWVVFLPACLWIGEHWMRHDSRLHRVVGISLLILLMVALVSLVGRL